MASKSPTVIDGLSSVRAVRRKGGSQAARTRRTPTHLPAQNRKPSAQAEPLSAVARIGHTVIPQKHDIVCYECGYAFTLPGKIKDTYCPKCRKILKVENFTIEGEWTRDLKTIGTIEIRPGAVVRDASLVALRIRLAGDIERASVPWCRTLDLLPGARFDLGTLALRDLNIAEGATIRLKRKVTCRNLEVRGTLRAPVYPSGCLRIMPGGMFGGEFHGSRLIVEDGGAMSAKVFLAKPEVKRAKRDKR